MEALFARKAAAAISSDSLTLARARGHPTAYEGLALKVLRDA